VVKNLRRVALTTPSPRDPIFVKNKEKSVLIRGIRVQRLTVFIEEQLYYTRLGAICDVPEGGL